MFQGSEESTVTWRQSHCCQGSELSFLSDQQNKDSHRDMDSVSAALACCLLLGLTVAQTEKADFNVTTSSPSGFNLSQTTPFVTPPNATVKATAISTASDDTTQSTVTARDNETTSHPQTSQSTTTVTPLTNSTSLTTTPAANHTPTSTVLTMPTSQSTADQSSTPDTAVMTATATSSHTVNNTADSDDRITQGSGLNISERNMTIVFSVGLGAFAVTLVIFMFHRCKQKVQYMHQPFNNTDDPDDFVTDGDTLVISGGLYDGHPIYDNVPTPPEDQSQFRLEFLH